MKKLVVVISTFILLFSLFLFFYFKKNSYTLEYKINDINVKETYDKDKKYYLFIFNYENKEYSFITYAKYSNKRKLVKDIKISKNDDLTCLKPEFDNIPSYQLCHNGVNQVDLATPNNPDLLKSYENFNIYDLNNKTYLLWNYHNFVYLNNKENKLIKLFTKDIYNINLITTYNNYLIVPDNNSEYTFNKIYLINKDNGKKEVIDLRYDLYYNDTYFLGNFKNNIYLYDKKQEQEYYINLKKKKIYKTSNKVLINNKWLDISTYKLKQNEGLFQNDSIFSYVIDNEKLYAKYLDYQIQISLLEAKMIVYQKDFDVYFLSDNTLYYYNPYQGLKKLISYSEWDFNYKNMIYIFD